MNEAAAAAAAAATKWRTAMMPLPVWSKVKTWVTMVRAVTATVTTNNCCLLIRTNKSCVFTVTLKVFVKQEKDVN